MIGTWSSFVANGILNLDRWNVADHGTMPPGAQNLVRNITTVSLTVKVVCCDSHVLMKKTMPAWNISWEPHFSQLTISKWTEFTGNIALGGGADSLVRCHHHRALFTVLLFWVCSRGVRIDLCVEQMLVSVASCACLPSDMVVNKGVIKLVRIHYLCTYGVAVLTEWTSFVDELYKNCHVVGADVESSNMVNINLSLPKF